MKNISKLAIIAAIMAVPVGAFAGPGDNAGYLTSKGYVDSGLILKANKTTVGNLADFDTTNKTNTVAAINEVAGAVSTLSSTAAGAYAVKTTETVAANAADDATEALANIGTLSTLATTVKTDTVSAINEVVGSVSTLSSNTMAKTACAVGQMLIANDAVGGYECVDVETGTYTE